MPIYIRTTLSAITFYSGKLVQSQEFYIKVQG